ncbi:ankyrin repeat domain-containing protein [Capsulimonas corticalis]|nr:ankyrin repeat domain-containing protein [Capsulimonas corticalis]
MNSPSSNPWEQRLTSIVKSPHFAAVLGAIGSVHPTMLVVLVLSEHNRWLRSLWPAGVYHSLFETFYDVSVCYGLVIGPLTIASAVRLFLHRAADPRANALTITRRLLVIPAMYLLSALWSAAWLSGHRASGFGEAVACLYLADQIVSNLYYGFRKPITDAALRAKEPAAGGLRLIALELWSMLATRVRTAEIKMRRRWWRRTHPDYLKKLSPQDKALYESAMRGESQNVEIFLARGANPNLTLNFGVPLIAESAAKGRTDVVCHLLNAGASVNAACPVDGFRALHRAASHGHLESARLLVAAGASLDARTRSGSTALIFAATAGHTSIVTLLLENQAPVDSVSKAGATALIAAATKGHHDMLQALLDAGANPSIKSYDGSSALTVAAAKGYADTLARLLKHGAHIDDATPDGRTGLIWAAYFGHDAAVRLLLEAGADPTIKAIDGKTALQFAKERGHATAAALIESQSRAVAA